MILALVNFLVFIVILVIVFLIIRWAASLLGVQFSPALMQIIGLILFLIVVIYAVGLFAGNGHQYYIFGR